MTTYKHGVMIATLPKPPDGDAIRQKRASQANN